MITYLGIETDIKTDCIVELSKDFFDLFVQFMKFQNYSELSQIGEIFNLDISFLQNVFDESMNDYLESDNSVHQEMKLYIEKTWISIQFFISKIEFLQSKIEENSNYYLSIKYNSRFDELENINKEMHEIMSIRMSRFQMNPSYLLHDFSDDELAGKKFKELTFRKNETEEFKFPLATKIDYFKTRNFELDLKKFKSLVYCFEKQGVKKMRLVQLYKS